MATVSFHHDQVGDLVIGTGINDGRWGYNLNTATFPTYGGMVVQILSVYIDDLYLTGTCATYNQLESIYSFFAAYFQIATQGYNQTPKQGAKVDKSSFNLLPVLFTYPDRQWSFHLYPKMAPGFRLDQQVVAPTWELQSFVVDDSPDLSLISDGIKGALIANTSDQGPLLTTPSQGTFSINGEISPLQGNPDTDPFQTYGGNVSQQQQVIGKYADYYNSLLPAYQKGDFNALGLGTVSKPANNTGKGKQTTTKPGATKKPSSTTTPPSRGKPGDTTPSGKSGPGYGTLYQSVYQGAQDQYRFNGCSGVVTYAGQILQQYANQPGNLSTAKRALIAVASANHCLIPGLTTPPVS